MQHPHEVDIVLAVLDTREMVVYGRDLRRPLGPMGRQGRRRWPESRLDALSRWTSSRPTLPRAGV